MPRKPLYNELAVWYPSATAGHALPAPVKMPGDGCVFSIQREAGCQVVVE